MIPSYGKVWALGHRAIHGIFAGPVVVQEKVDGSQISFMLKDGKLWVRSKSAPVLEGCPPVEGVQCGNGMFQLAVDQIIDRACNLDDGRIYRGEYLSKPKHNTLVYDRVPDGNIALFDIECPSGTHAHHEALALEARAAGFDAVPTLFNGTVADFSELQTLLDTESFLGGTKIEGFVVKRYDMLTTFGHVAMGKYVSEAFKEKHTKAWRADNPTKNDVVARIIDEYGTQQRWEKALQHIAERGELAGDPRDIGQLMKEVSVDLEEECADEIAQALYSHFRRDILRGCTKMLPHWYKAKLATEAFE